MRISLFNKLNSNSLTIEGVTHNNNLNFKLLDYSGYIPTILTNSIEIYVTTTPSSKNEFRTIAEALEYVSKYRVAYDRNNQNWIRIIIKSGYVIEESTHIRNIAFQRVIIESEDDVVTVRTANMIRPPYQYTFWNQRWEVVIFGDEHTVLPLINFSMVTDQPNTNLIAILVANCSTLIVVNGNSFDGFYTAIRVEESSKAITIGTTFKNCHNSAVAVDDGSNVNSCYCNIINCGMGYRVESNSTLDFSQNTFTYGPNSKRLVWCNHGNTVSCFSWVINNWAHTRNAVIDLNNLTFLTTGWGRVNNSPGITLYNIQPNVLTPNGLLRIIG